MSASWLTSTHQPGARLRLVAFPFAGGSASAFRTWPEALGPEIELVCAHLPGRERRMSEFALASIDAMVAQVAEAITLEVEPPYALFGHSMGGIIAYELAREVARRGETPPIGVIVSAVNAPHVRDRRPPIHDLPEEEFVQALRDLGGTPEAVFANRELVDLLLPALRADFEAVESYTWSPGPPIRCPLVAYIAPDDDDIIDRADVEAWCEYSEFPLEPVMFPGGHFFLLNHTRQLVEQVRVDVQRFLERQPPAPVAEAN